MFWYRFLISHSPYDPTAAARRGPRSRTAGFRSNLGGPRIADRRRRFGCRATAILEFALAMPVIGVLLGGGADLGLAGFCRTSLAGAVAAGAQYAFATGPTVTAANIRTVVQKASWLNAANSTVTVSAPTGYCLIGSPPATSAATAGTTCSDGSLAGTYVTITATYQFNGLMNGYMSASTLSATESSLVRLN
jgi:Flp pilus assembly protein TadG